MNCLVFYSSQNTKGKKDASGAFIPEAGRLIRYLRRVFPDYMVTGIAIETKGKTKAERRQQIEDTLYHEKKKGRIYDSVYFLCHGWKTGFQFGYSWNSGAYRLASVLVEHNPAVEMVTFYSCLVSKDRDNFSKWLFDEVERLRPPRFDVPLFQVFGHYTKGHTTMNPRIKIYSRGFAPFIWSTKPVEGYNPLVSGNSKQLVDLMRKPKSELRYAIVFVPRVLKKYGFIETLKRS